LSLASIFLLYGQIKIFGTVKDPAGKPIAGAMVSGISAGKSTTTGSNGVYAIATGTMQVFPDAANRNVAQPTVKGSTFDDNNEAASNLAKIPASGDSMLAGAVGYNN
jgi:hypothetical protein